MTFAINVKGGTNAGRRRIRKPARAWEHFCDGKRDNLGSPVMRWCAAALTRCPDCGTRRP